jgi:membrane-associated protease RseP (regulator of RpoE activity)
MALALLVGVAVLHVGLLLVTRPLVARLAGRAAPSTLRARIAMPVTVTVLSYLVATVCCTAAACLAGGDYLPPDELDATVRVVPGSPAAAAGLHDGDRIVAIDGASVAHFVELAPRIRGRAADAVEVVVERDGSQRSLSVTPDEGKIGVLAVRRQRPIGAGAALRAGATEPFRVVRSLVEAMTMPAPQPDELRGPVEIVREVELPGPRHQIATWLLLFGGLHPVLWPFLWIAAVVWGPKRG